MHRHIDTGADRSFISTAFSSLINIAPTPLENCYDVELADGKLVRIDTIIRAQEYMAKGCQVFLAQIFAKKKEDKSEGTQIKDVPIVRDFPEVFPEDCPGSTPPGYRPNVIPNLLNSRAATTEARAPYRLATIPKMKELSNNFYKSFQQKRIHKALVPHLGEPVSSSQSTKDRMWSHSISEHPTTMS
ncbi:hypothetical protein Tco_1125201 [Tanacetum coccineum]|uniref:Reverse transcriptase domain-containing protein n=1 Tax=Tanacetum coccineum TaxID=301880 RepID=A0ABQ5J8C8_9ASTR